jgi:hypothetical protein
VTAHRSLPDGFVSLAASVRLHSEPERIVEVLRGRRGPWADGAVEPPPAPGLRRHLVDLRLRLGGEATALTTFRKAAYVDLGEPRRIGDRWEADIGWRAATAAPLFPVFSGRIVVERTGLRIEGVYAPPGGAIGRAADRLLLHVAANATARWLLTELDRAALEAAA